MSETSRTKQIRTTLLNHFGSSNDSLCHIMLSKEFPCNGQCRCDLAGYEYHDDKPYASIGIEIKQSRSDFYSGRGLNFTFDVNYINYICIPSELVGEAVVYLKEHELFDVGIIEWLGNNTVRLIKKPSYNFMHSLNRNDCILRKDSFNNLYDTPDSVYSFKKNYWE